MEQVFLSLDQDFLIIKEGNIKIVFTVNILVKKDLRNDSTIIDLYIEDNILKNGYS